jgi:chlorophyll synthase
VPQALAAMLLAYWGHGMAAAMIAGLLGLQGLAMRRWLSDPRALAPWYNGAGVTLYVAGMMACAVALAPGGAP